MRGHLIAHVAGLCIGAVQLAGCAVGNVGALVSDVTHGNGAYVVAVTVAGGHLRLRAEDGGWTMGYSQLLYVFADSAAVPAPAEGRYYLHAPMPAAAPVAVDMRVVGLDLRADGAEVAIGVGLRASTLIARADRHASAHTELAFERAAPERTRYVDHCRGARC